MPKAPPPYLPEFREDAVRLFRVSGKSMAAFAAHVRIARATLRNWAKQQDVDDENAPGATPAEREALCKLRHEIGVLHEESELLREAATTYGRYLQILALRERRKRRGLISSKGTPGGNRCFHR